MQAAARSAPIRRLAIALAAGGFWVAALSVGLLVPGPGGGLGADGPEPTAGAPQAG